MRLAMHVYKRGNRWYIRVKEGGRDILRRSLGKDITTRQQAEAACRQIEAELRAGTSPLIKHLDPSQDTLQGFLDRFSKERKGELAPKTIKRYKVAVEALIADVGNAKLRTLTTGKIRRWGVQRLQNGVTPEGVNCDLRHIKAFLRKAVEWGSLEKAPDIKFVKSPRRLPRHLSQTEIEKLLKAENDPVRKRLWIFFLWTGVRRAEAKGLTWQNVHLDTDKPFARVIGKGDQERTVPLLPVAVEALGPSKDIGPVWPQVHLDTYTHWFRKAARKAKLEAHLHDLRHTCATFLLSKGVPVKAVQMILGHSDIKVTEGYARAFAGSLYDAMTSALDDKGHK